MGARGGGKVILALPEGSPQAGHLGREVTAPLSPRPLERGWRKQKEGGAAAPQPKVRLRQEVVSAAGQRRGQRIAMPVRKFFAREKRPYGLGMVGRLTNRTYRKRIDSYVKRQIEDMDDHRCARVRARGRRGGWGGAQLQAGEARGRGRARIPLTPRPAAQAVLHLLAHLRAFARHHPGGVHLRHRARGLLAARDGGLGERGALPSPDRRLQSAGTPSAALREERARAAPVSSALLQVLRNRGVYENVKYVQQENFWIGPSSVRAGPRGRRRVGTLGGPGRGHRCPSRSPAGGAHSPGRQVLALHAPGPAGAQFHPRGAGAREALRLLRAQRPVGLRADVGGGVLGGCARPGSWLLRCSGASQRGPSAPLRALPPACAWQAAAAAGLCGARSLCACGACPCARVSR